MAENLAREILISEILDKIEHILSADHLSEEEKISIIVQAFKHIY